MGQFVPVYHTGTSFIPEFQTDTYQYIAYQFIFFFHFWQYLLVLLLRSIRCFYMSISGTVILVTYRYIFIKYAAPSKYLWRWLLWNAFLLWYRPFVESVSLEIFIMLASWRSLYYCSSNYVFKIIVLDAAQEGLELIHIAFHLLPYRSPNYNRRIIFVWCRNSSVSIVTSYRLDDFSSISHRGRKCLSLPRRPFRL
jgi:hypothetical protein